MFDVKQCLSECEEKMQMTTMYLEDYHTSAQVKPMCIYLTLSALILMALWCR